MMIPERPSLERRVLSALEGAGGTARIPVVLGGCGTGRTSLLLRVRDLIGRSSAQFIDVERIATTPERMFHAVKEASPFAFPAGPAAARAEASARAAFEVLLDFVTTARAPGDAPATFLLDEFLELRTFESFPGLRSVLRDLVAALATSGNRFVLTSRYTARALRVLRDAPAQFEIVHVAPLTAAEIRATLPSGGDADRSSAVSDADDDRTRDEFARLVQAISEGRPAYARMLVDTASAMATRGAADPVSALAALLAPGGALARQCTHCYELRLHRARGYGALKAILEVLAEEEPLTLTEIALRLRRTPGSTKDYLSWLEDVDLIVSRQKRYSFADPMMRLWVRLHCRPTPPTNEDVVREVHRFVMSRIPAAAEPPHAMALAGEPAAERDKSWGIIEID
jgi:hypothetical protein